MDKNKLEFQNSADIFNEGGVYVSTVPSFDFGLYYYKTKFYFGLSVTHLTQHEFNFYEETLLNGGSTDYFLRTHLFINSGYVFEINDNFVFKPSLLWNSLIGTLLNRCSPSINGVVIPGSSINSDMSASIMHVKTKLKAILLKVQCDESDSMEWVSQNFYRP